ncbi:hypothetical protein VF21_00244 [Pseudogymnoascus sp. 05NY08]|nr:hypothetical protein VF21_00244 [Pseudogymnoascus sp. 05NY08]
MSEMWTEAEKAFESICHQSLQRGDVKGFDDVQRMIEEATTPSYSIDAEQKDKWEKAKSVGLESLKYLTMLVGAASLAASTIPIPESVANITGHALYINNVDQELCAHFLWDLAHKAIREKFNFNFDAASALHGSSQAVIAVDEFEANHTIVKLTFKYLEKGHIKQTKDIVRYLVCWLPFHLDRLRCLEDKDMGMLTPNEKLDIGRNLYKLFKDDQVIRRHRANFEPVWWEVEEMENVQKWLTDSAVLRRLDKTWLDEVYAATRPTRGFLKELVKIVVEGFLREREWEVASAYYWIEKFLSLHKQLVPELLRLQDTELNSLWYERLAEAAATQSSKADTVLLFYQRAIEKENPSWLCHRGLGITHFGQNQTQKAIKHIELALKEAEEEGATPKPAAKDIDGLHLLLGQYNYSAGDVETAATHYSAVRKSEDPARAKEGQLGYLKAVLKFQDAEGMRDLLKTTLATEDGKGRMVNILKMIARDADHDFLISKMFTVVKGHLDLLKGIVCIMETATAMPAPTEDRIAEMSEDDRFAGDETRGVLLCDRGFAAYMYKESLSGTEAVGDERAGCGSPSTGRAATCSLN